VRLESVSNCYELRAIVSLTAGLPISGLDPQIKGEDGKEEKRGELGWVFGFGSRIERESPGFSNNTFFVKTKKGRKEKN